jgi:dimethylargininase
LNIQHSVVPILALTREVSPRITECELTFLERKPIDVEKAIQQHVAYERALESLGCHIEPIEPAPDHPDGVFVEDAAVVLDEVAIIPRLGAESRRGEVDSVARAVQRYRPLMHMEEPGTLDGGDVLRVGRTLYVGTTERTNSDGIRQLREFVAAFSYTVRPVEVHGCLHLKTAATEIDDDTVLINPLCVEASVFTGLQTLAVDPREPFAANALRIGDTLLMATAHERTSALLERRGYRVMTIDISEMQKAEAGVTCCSLIFPAVPPA